MGKTVHLSILFKLLAFCLFITASESILSQNNDTLKPKNVLMLFALEPAQPVYEYIIENVKKKIRSDFPHPLNFYMDFVELSRFSDEEHLTDFFDYYNKKYAARNFDLFISIGPSLYPVVKKYGSPLLDSIPKIYLEINFVSIKNPFDIKGDKETVVYLEIDYKGHIDYALKLFPDCKNIYVVSGTSNFDNKFAQLFDQAFAGFGNKYKITRYTGIKIPDLINKVQALPPNSLIFVNTYQSDSSGISFYSTELIRSIRNHSNAPIFYLFDAALEGTIGGLVINSSRMGEKIGEVSVQILNGKTPGSIDEYHDTFFDYMFDWKQLKKWNIDITSLPEESIIINREYSFSEKYRAYIIAGLIFIIVETFLIIFLLYLYRKQKNQSVKIHEQEERYRSLVDFNRLTELSELTASLSHELNQPLTAILSSSQAAQRFLMKDKFDRELFDEILVNIVEDVKRASGVMNSLRSMIKKDTGEKKRVNLNTLAKDIFNLFYSQAAVKDIKISVIYDESEPFIFADSILIQQVILNLLLNASEALERKTGADKEILLKTEAADGFVNVHVSDNGPGVSENLRGAIFKPFFSTKHTGLGIGLAICRSIIEDHDGKIMFRNNDNGGSTFSFKLKAVQ